MTLDKIKFVRETASLKGAISCPTFNASTF